MRIDGVTSVIYFKIEFSESVVVFHVKLVFRGDRHGMEEQRWGNSFKNISSASLANDFA